MNIQLSDHFNYSKLFRFTLPSVIMMMVTSVYSVVDGLFVSNLVGDKALAAVNIIFPLTMIVGAFGFMMGTGGSAEVARVMGTGEGEKAKEYFTTLILVLVSMTLCTIVSLPIGIQTAVKPNSFLSNITAAFSMIGIALPTFWLGLMLILLFSVKLNGLLPAIGSVSPTGLIMPSITLAASFMAGTMRTTRSSMLDCLNQDYIRTAKAKGVAHGDVINKHALKNALLPVITVVGMNVGSQMGGSVLTETVFSYPGLGVMLMNDIKQTDTPTILVGLVVMALCIGICNLLVDVLFAFIDPRIKSQYSKGR